MENEKKSSLNLEKVGMYLAMVATIFMFWQVWRDLHKDNADLKERIAKLEVKVDHLEDK